MKLVADLEPEKEVTLIGEAKTQETTLLRPGDNGKILFAHPSLTCYINEVRLAEELVKAPTKLLRLEDKFVSQVQEANGYFPDVSVCELPPSLLSLFELLEDL